ncbi:MAG: protein-export membrane protein SecF [Candidatus Doudnabacteria bacterium RIFCSPHIGHO2_01_FULL_43_23]|uniref:Protein-export membrane protein SecF n=1 Tax=Candidatus Doudnabacteria bacterium RIFCSPHIGHO2_01_FULL_43_23 TaxID=1817822 RepID=A0A1F5NUB4_9BACT|nr:MAG: protein-export membrane protein SecF [Candidatus Doudnabacteria bacterium RIFCSPHIGHO2_01_FULL_43_23]
MKFLLSKHYKKFFVLSGVLVLTSIIFLIVFGLKPGIDFTGGSLLHLEFENPVLAPELSGLLSDAGYGSVVAQPSGDREMIIKTRVLNSEDDRAEILSLIKENFGNFEELRFDSVGPVIGQELKSKAIWQTIVVVLGILLYVAYAFRKITESKITKEVNSWRLSLAAVVALIHDVVIVMGVFALFGKLYNVEVDVLFVTAILTTLGLSVNDTIVVFDRLRENMQKQQGYNFSEIVDKSISETVVRSVNTSSTIIFVLMALAFFGGETTFYFVIALIVGITVGTYSSIFVASPILLLWKSEE